MRTMSILIAVAAFAWTASAAFAADGCGPAGCGQAACGGKCGGKCGGAKCGCGAPNCCARCGRQAACLQKTCQLLCEVKKEKKPYWCVETEEFCTLLPGHRDHCTDPCSPVPPQCARPKCVKKLVKKEQEIEVPVYRCAVLYLCPDCYSSGSAPAAAPNAAPQPPVAPAPPAPTPAPPPAPRPNTAEVAPLPRF